MFLIIARDENDGFGKGGRLPWVCLDDIQLFRDITSHTPHPTKSNLLIAGHTTRQSMPRTLRRRILVTSNRDGTYQLPSGVSKTDIDQVFLIGGKQTITNHLQSNPPPTCIVLTRIHGVYDCDVTITDAELGLGRYRIYAKKRMTGATVYLYVLVSARDQSASVPVLPTGCAPVGLLPDEMQYISLIRSILENDEDRTIERTGMGTKSIFGHHLRFDLADTFPLLTTKRVFFRGVVEELAWFLNSDTNSNTLEQRRVQIWKGNTTRSFLESRGLSYPEGIAGPIYGAQWRHWGGIYDPETGESIGGTDQLQRVVHSLRHDPESRRHLVSAWNVDELDNMALPPCHVMFQFYATGPGRDGKRRLKCQLYQRSCDVALGLPFNIASYALLTHLIARECEMVADELILTIGDCHIYTTHLEALKLQNERTPLPPPTLNVLPMVGAKRDSLDVIDRFLDDPMGEVVLHDYLHHGSLPMEMVP